MRTVASILRSVNTSLVLACLVAVLGGFGVLFGLRGTDHYSPPGYGGPEPFETHRGAVEILEHGRTQMVFHPPGYSYIVALVYSVLPELPLSMIVVQILLLPVVVLASYRIAEFLEAGPPLFFAWGSALYLPYGYFACGFNSIYCTMLAVVAVLALAPPLISRASQLRSAGVGLAIGVAGCLRPNFALVGAAVWGGLWLATRRPLEFMRRGLVMAVVALLLFMTVTTLNPPAEGQSMRGGFGLWAGLLVATYQYQYQWWDWDFYFQDSYRGFREYAAHIAAVEQESGFPATDPRSEAVLRREALSRLFGMPLNTLKKIVISSVRIWVLVPTHIEALAPRLAVGGVEIAILLAAIFGFTRLRRSPYFWMCLGVVLVPTLTHMVLHVEPRYALPGKPVEVVASLVGVRHGLLLLHDRFLSRIKA